MNERSRSLLYCLLFCLMLGLIVGYQLHSSYHQAKSLATERTEGMSFLVGEWIKGAFQASDYVLQDIVYTVPVTELQYPAVNADSHAHITQYIDNKRQTLPNASGVGLNDSNCIVTHTLSIVGFDASQREWCSIPKNNPDINTYVSNLFTSNNGELMVIQARKFPGTEFSGMAGIGVNLSFFSTWLSTLSVGKHGVIAIFDSNSNLLARKPAHTQALGVKVDDPLLAGFVQSEEQKGTYSTTSPLDGEPRLYSVRKLNELPFIVIVGEADQDWQSGWLTNLRITIAGLLLLWGLAFVYLKTYWQRLDALAEVKQARDAARKLSLIDGLTGLANRRHLEEQLDTEYRRVTRNQSPLSLIIMDIDNFKAFNDTYGHISGDDCLRSISDTVKSNLKRAQDLAARYGGEEFCCILPDTDHEAAIRIAENIRCTVAELNIPHKSSTVADHVTVSLGVATSSGSTDNHDLPQTLVELADKRLYWAKNHGKNCVKGANPVESVSSTT